MPSGASPPPPGTWGLGYADGWPQPTPFAFQPCSFTSSINHTTVLELQGPHKLNSGSTHAWFMVARRCPRRGESGRGADREAPRRGSATAQGWESGGWAEVGEESCCRGCLEEKVHPLKIMALTGMRKLVCECCCFTVYKALEHVFSLSPEWQPCRRPLGGWGAHLQPEETEAQRIWLRPLHPLPHLHS